MSIKFPAMVKYTDADHIYDTILVKDQAHLDDVILSLKAENSKAVSFTIFQCYAEVTKEVNWVEVKP